MSVEEKCNTIDVVVRGAEKPKPIEKLIESAVKRAGSQSEATGDAAGPQIETGDPASGSRPRYKTKEER